MPVVAAPAYLGQDFSRASPGLRFGMYLPLWGIDRRTGELTWEKRDYKYEVRGQEKVERRLPHENKREALDGALKLTDDDRAAMRAIVARQAALAAGLAEQQCMLTVTAQAVAPFTTGLGNEHPLENGFAFLNPYGLPYLAGSGVKGVLRQAARELAGGEWGDACGWSEEAITALFGLESNDGDKTHQRGALMFWDVPPELAGESLQVEVMTAHQGHYYQPRDPSKADARSGGSASPHDSGQPNPVNFLTVPPGSRFTFHVRCDVPFLRLLAPALAEGGRWQVLLQTAFEHAFAWLGFGGKTAVGYGAMKEDDAARELRRAAREAAAAAATAAAEQARLEAMSPADRDWAKAQPEVEKFRAELAKAKAAGAYTPGRTFDQARLAFMKAASAWTEPRSRAAAGEALAESATKAWGRPSNKERWAELQAAIAKLKGEPQ
jgi:CRISPR-associated protein Cmr6